MQPLAQGLLRVIQAIETPGCKVIVKARRGGRQGGFPRRNFANHGIDRNKSRKGSRSGPTGRRQPLPAPRPSKTASSTSRASRSAADRHRKE
jgi:hypothetical protein